MKKIFLIVLLLLIFSNNSLATDKPVVVNKPHLSSNTPYFKRYMQRLTKLVTANWRRNGVSSYGSYSLEIVIQFKIEKNGNANSIVLVNSSNNPGVDFLAIKTINEIQPFEPLPQEYAGKEITVQFTFRSYNPRSLSSHSNINIPSDAALFKELNPK